MIQSLRLASTLLALSLLWGCSSSSDPAAPGVDGQQQGLLGGGEEAAGASVPKLGSVGSQHAGEGELVCNGTLELSARPSPSLQGGVATQAAVSGVEDLLDEHGVEQKACFTVLQEAGEDPSGTVVLSIYADEMGRVRTVHDTNESTAPKAVRRCVNRIARVLRTINLGGEARVQATYVYKAGSCR